MIRPWGWGECGVSSAQSGSGARCQCRELPVGVWRPCGWRAASSPARPPSDPAARCTGVRPALPTRVPGCSAAGPCRPAPSSRALRRAGESLLSSASGPAHSGGWHPQGRAGCMDGGAEAELGNRARGPLHLPPRARHLHSANSPLLRPHRPPQRRLLRSSSSATPRPSPPPTPPRAATWPGHPP